MFRKFCFASVGAQGNLPFMSNSHAYTVASFLITFSTQPQMLGIYKATLGVFLECQKSIFLLGSLYPG